MPDHRYPVDQLAALHRHVGHQQRAPHTGAEATTPKPPEVSIAAANTMNATATVASRIFDMP
jgi:hypothetical protein